MYKKIKTTRLGIREQDVIFDEVADLIEASNKLLDTYYEKFEPSPRQEDVRDIYYNTEIPEGQTLHLLMFGSVGSAKTWTAFSLATEVLGEHPEAEGLGVRATYDDLSDALFRPYTKFLDQFEVGYWSKQKPPTVTLYNGSRFRMRSSERTSRSRSDKADELGGTKYSVCIIDEADSVSEEFARTLAGRMRDDAGVKHKLIIYICNPPSEDHWLYEWFFVNADPDDPKSAYRAIHMHMEDNPYLPEGYKESVERDYGHNPMLFKRMYEGKFGPAVKGYPVFAGIFNKDLHVAERPIAANWNRKYPLQRCWDFGWRHPACVVFQDDQDTGQIRVLKSWLGSKVVLDVFADQIITECHRCFPGAEWEDFCDPAGVQKTDKTRFTSIDILRGKGLKVRYRGTSLEYGVSIISEQLATLIPYKTGSIPSIILDPDAGLIIDSLQLGYCIDKDHKEDTKTPIKIEKDGYYEHLLDAFRYGIIFKRKPNQGRRRDFTQNGAWRSVDKAALIDRGNTAQNYKPINLLTGRRSRRRAGIGSYNFKGRR